MNQSIKYGHNSYYDITAGNVRTVDGNTVEIDHQLIIADLPPDVSNDQLITVDNLGRLYSLDKSSLPGGNPFDQSLNTTDSVELGSDGAPPSVKLPVDTTLKLNTDATGTFLGCYKDGETVPHVNISSIGNFSPDGSINMGVYHNGTDFIMTQPRGFSIDNTSTDSWFHSWSGVIGGIGTGDIAFNFRHDNYVRFYNRVLLGDNVDTSASIPDHICAIGTSANNCVKTTREDLFGQDLQTTSDVEFNDLTINTGGIPSESDADFVMIKQTNDVIKQVAPEDLFNQSLYENGNPTFDDLTLTGTLTLETISTAPGNTRFLTINDDHEVEETGLPAPGNPFDQDLNTFNEVSFKSGEFGTVTGNISSSKLKISAVPGVAPSPNFTTFGSEIHIYNDGNDKPLGQFNAFSVDDQEILMGLYTTPGTPSPYRASSESFFRMTRGVNSLNFDKNNGVQTIGTDITFKQMLEINDVGVHIKSVADFFIDDLQTELSSVNLICNSSNQLKQISKTTIWGQDLSTSDDVTFNNIFADGLVQTDTILENTLNNGVDVASWSIKSQKLTSDALVSTSDPLIIDLKFNADIDSAIQIYAEQHDNVGIMYDMRHINGTDSDSFISSSVNGNFFWNKIGGTLELLAQNAIPKGSAVSKASMNKVVEFTKTSINLIQNVVFQAGVIMDNLTTDDGTNEYILTQKDLTDEVMKRLYEPAYGSLGILRSLVPTVINTVDVWEQVTLVGSSSPLKNFTYNGTTDLIFGKSGIYMISYDFSVSTGVTLAREIELALFIDQSSTITASVSNVTINNAAAVYCSAQSFMYDATAGEEIGLFVRNRTNDDDIIIQTGQICIHRIID